MKQLKTILLTTDFGSGSASAMETAIALAKAFQAKLVLMHVVVESLLQFILQRNDVEETEKRLVALAEQIAKQGINQPEIFVGKGVPAEAIYREAVQRNADLIIVGCGSKGSSGKYRPGVTTERLVRLAITPVWIARPDAAPVPRRILCPTDTSQASRRALKNALALCRKCDAELTVLNVREPMRSIQDSIGGLSREEEHARLNQQQNDFFAFLAATDFSGVDWTKKVRYGVEDVEIVDEAREQHADLIAMGTVGKTEFEQVAMGSVTQRVLRELPSPILTMKEEDVVQLRLDTTIASIEEHSKNGKELLKSGKLEEAIREFDQCLLSSPTYAVAWEGKASAYERLGNEKDAERARTAAERIRKIL